MKLSFKRKRIEKKYKKYEMSDRKVAKLSMSIESATLFSDLGHNAHFLEGNFKNFFAMDLLGHNNPKRLICYPGKNTKQDNNGDWVLGTMIEVVVSDITDHYKK